MVQEFQELDGQVGKSWPKVFQSDLVALAMIFSGGQRTQVIAGLTIEVGKLRLKFQDFHKVNEGDFYVLKPSSEKVIRRGSSLIPIASFLGTLLDFFVENVRPLLLAENPDREKILSMWVNTKGKIASQ